MDYPKNINHIFDGVECECSVTKDHNDEYVVEVIQPVDYEAPVVAEGEEPEAVPLKGRFIKYPADHTF